jgi:hypothetical protein
MRTPQLREGGTMTRRRGSSDADKEDHEKRVFREFAKLSGLPIELVSIENRKPRDSRLHAGETWADSAKGAPSPTLRRRVCNST